MATALKWGLEFLALILTTAMVVYANSLVRRGAGLDPPKIKLSLSTAKVYGIAVLVAIAIAAVAHLIDLPSLLQKTHPEVVDDKYHQRSMCIMALERVDEIGAEEFIRNATVSKNLQAEFNALAKPNFQRTLQRVANRMFFHVGTLWSVLPGIMQLGIIVGATKLPALNKLIPNLSLVVGMLPVVNGVTTMAVVVFGAYQLWVVPGQVTNCRIASGHWYTYWHTTLAGLLVVAHLYHHRKHKNARNSLLFYASWMAIYQAVAFTVLANSQKFHHDSAEAKEGLWRAMVISPVVLAAGFGVAYWTSSAGSDDGAAQEIKPAEVATAVIKETESRGCVDVGKGWVMAYQRLLDHSGNEQCYPYWYKESTGESSWVEPDEIKAAAPTPAPQPVEPKPIPEGPVKPDGNKSDLKKPDKPPPPPPPPKPPPRPPVSAPKPPPPPKAQQPAVPSAPTHLDQIKAGGVKLKKVIRKEEPEEFPCRLSHMEEQIRALGKAQNPDNDDDEWDDE